VGVLLVAVVLLGSVAAGLALTPRPGAPAPAASATPVTAPTPVARPSPPITGPEPLAFGPPGTPSPVVHAAQSRLWFHADRWWGVLLDASTGSHRIFVLDPSTATWSDTGALVDDRHFAKLDVLWDGQSLVVASAGPDPEERHALLVSRYSYDPAVGRYARDPNFPVPITNLGVEAVTITRDVAGRLWVAYRQGGAVVLDHSLETDLVWRGPFVPSLADGPAEEAAIASIGSRVALTWTRPAEDVVRVVTHRVDGPPDIWEELPAASVAGLSAARDSLSVAVDNAPGAERLYVAVATPAEESETRGRLDPQAVLVEFTFEAPPMVYLVGRLQEQHADPVVVVNAAARELYVIAGAPRGGGSVYYKEASLDAISFPPGLGTLLIPASEALPEMGHPTSTKQALDATSGLLVAATDPGAGLYGFGALGLRPAAATGPTPAPSVDTATTVFEQTFDGLAVGGSVPGWELEGEPPPQLAVTVLRGVDSSARLSSSSTTDARACAAFRVPSASVLRLEAEILYNLATGDDLRLLQARGSGGEFASLRLRDDELVFFDNETRIRSGVTIDPGRWYRAMMTLDLNARTYDISVVEITSDRTILEESDLAIRAGAIEIPNRVCAEIPPQPGLDLYLDDVRVVAEP
jgi:hypothetical protein